MKKDLHPEYAETTISCACGNIIRVRSAGRKMSVNTCSACHPFFTGKATLIDTAGRVEQFKRRYGGK
jgi:large subunit ribosomal protein L31